jgi:hypothetical protein
MFAASFIPENFREVFGDWKCNGTGKGIPVQMNGYTRLIFDGCNMTNAVIDYHLPTWHWGFRHYLWVLLGFVMLIVNATKLIQEAKK